jgi:hypothetical protein
MSGADKGDAQADSNSRNHDHGPGPRPHYPNAPFQLARGGIRPLAEPSGLAVFADVIRNAGIRLSATVGGHLTAQPKQGAARSPPKPMRSRITLPTTPHLSVV